MNLATDRICANEPDIVSKIMDGEAILINLQTGAYYSLRDAGAVMWHALYGHRTRDEIMALVTAHYPDPIAGLDSDVSELLAALVAENLVRASTRREAVDHDLAGLPVPPPPYRHPVLEKFSDMEELLALDPPTPGVLDGLMRRPLSKRED